MMRQAVFILASLTIGCFSNDRCEREPCPPPEADTCEGVCAPFVGGLWEPVLVTTARTKNQGCPDIAPAPATSSSTIIACGVQEADGECSSEQLVCLRSEPGWTACVVRDGTHDCPMFYEEPIEAETGVTLCCPPNEPPA